MEFPQAAIRFAWHALHYCSLYRRVSAVQYFYKDANALQIVRGIQGAYDLDVFIFLPAQTGPLITMSPLYDILRERGYVFDAEHVIIHDTPVQFLPAYNPLSEEAVREAVFYDYEETPVRVIRPEHLVALAFQTGGRHRRIRAEALLEDGDIDADRLNAILARRTIILP